MTLPDQHGPRYDLVNELHARPVEKCDGPHQISHYAFLHHADGDPAQDREHIVALCRRFGANPPATDANHHLADLGKIRVKWELHTEFSTYTFFRAGVFEKPFRDTASEFVPSDWLDKTPGELTVALHIAVENAAMPIRPQEELDGYFIDPGLVVSRLDEGRGTIWTDFRLHSDGHARILLRNETMSPRQTGRLVQRLIEIQTYFVFALIALPIARKAAATLPDIDKELAELTTLLATRIPEEKASAEKKTSYLDRLTKLSAEIEALATATAFRFGASDAYYAIVMARVAALREERMEGYQTHGGFLDRRLAPAMRTCLSVATRIDDLARRTTRTANLMRTQVDVSIQAQNQQLLKSMNRRAQLQLRLQQTVEGLSVAAISYYAVGLVGYIAKGLSTSALTVNVELVQGISAPVIILGVWLLLRRFRRHLERSDRDGL